MASVPAFKVRAGMLALLQVLTVMVVALPAALALAHALELPGKRRLDESTYRAVQRIYYPGFTIGGIAEPVTVVLTALLLAFTPAGEPAFWLVLAALVGLLAMNAVYWFVVHPVNRHWMAGERVGASATAFFGAGGGPGQADWRRLRDRWEVGHVARAVLAGLSLLALVASLVVRL